MELIINNNTINNSENLQISATNLNLNEIFLLNFVQFQKAYKENDKYFQTLNSFTNEKIFIEFSFKEMYTYVNIFVLLNNKTYKHYFCRIDSNNFKKKINFSYNMNEK
jgi:hypothetical protein